MKRPPLGRDRAKAVRNRLLRACRDEPDRLKDVVRKPSPKRTVA